MEDAFVDTLGKVILAVFAGMVVYLAVSYMIATWPGKSDKKITTNKPSELEKCANCGRDIGKLEKTHIFKDNTVCAECYPKLKSQEQTA